jgi:hypothetical protein
MLAVLALRDPASVWLTPHQARSIIPQRQVRSNCEPDYKLSKIYSESEAFRGFTLPKGVTLQRCPATGRHSPSSFGDRHYGWLEFQSDVSRRLARFAARCSPV